MTELVSTPSVRIDRSFRSDLVVPDSFFEPLPENLLDAFEGGANNRSESTGLEEGAAFE